jgi:glycosyltransferase involved in cell wall biosynthesis
MASNSAGYLAYTPGVRDFLTSQRVPGKKIHVLFNTIDTVSHRRAYEKVKGERARCRKRLGLEGRKVLLYVGRADGRKRLGDLTRALTELRREDPSFLLLAVGTGPTGPFHDFSDQIGSGGILLAPGTGDPDVLAPLCASSDLFVFPGDVGLGCLQAMCYDVPSIVIDAPTHNPEYEYLTRKNAVILPRGSDWMRFAAEIRELFLQPHRLYLLRAATWPSVSHLTVDAMAHNFLEGIEAGMKRGA